MLLADMQTKEEVAYDVAKHKHDYHELRTYGWCALALLVISLPVVQGIISGVEDNGFGLLDVIGPCIWACFGVLVIRHHIVPNWRHDEQKCGKLRSEMRVFHSRPVRMDKHDRIERWRSNDVL